MEDSGNRSEQLYGAYLLLNRTFRIIRRWRRFELSQHGFRLGFMGMLHYIAQSETNLTLSKLATLACLEPNTVTETVDRMEKGGLVKKERDPKDKRVIRVSLTQKGFDTYALSTRHRQVVQDVWGCLTSEELEQFSMYLKRLCGKAQHLNKR